MCSCCRNGISALHVRMRLRQIDVAQCLDDEILERARHVVAEIDQVVETRPVDVRPGRVVERDASRGSTDPGMLTPDVW